jgi:uncharacterized protein (DUF1501 family)
MLIKRKDFIQIGSLATATVFVPKFLKAFEAPKAVPQGNKVVVIIQLSGGNDGLNTIIPFRNDLYYSNRPRLAIQKNEALALTDEAALHPSLGSVLRSCMMMAVWVFSTALVIPIPIKAISEVWISGILQVKVMSTGIPAGLEDTSMHNATDATSQRRHWRLMIRAESCFKRRKHKRACPCKTRRRLYTHQPGKILQRNTCQL